MDDNNAKLIFSALIQSLYGASMISMGKIPDPISGEVDINLQQASANIDMIDALKIKTAGNLDKEESTLIDTVLTNLRLTYIDEVERQKEDTPPETSQQESKDDKTEE